MHPNVAMGSLAPEIFLSRFPDTVEKTVTESVDIPHEPHEEKASVVDKEGIDLKAAAFAVPLLDHTYYICKLKRPGSALQSTRNPGEMGLSRCRSLEHIENTGSLFSPDKFGG